MGKNNNNNNFINNHVFSTNMMIVKEIMEKQKTKWENL